MVFAFIALSYVIALIFTIFLIFFAVNHVIAFDDLKNEYKDPIKHCNELNPLILPEYICHVIVNVFFLFSFQWFALLFNVGLIVYHARKYMNRPVMSCSGLYDPTTILNMDLMKSESQEGWIKLGYYLISFFYYLYGLLYELITSNSDE